MIDNLIIAAYGDIKTAKTTFGLSLPKPLVIFDLDQSYVRASMRYMKGNKDLTSKIVTQVDRLQDHHLQNADIVVIQYKMPLKFPGKKRVGFLELWEG